MPRDEGVGITIPRATTLDACTARQSGWALSLGANPCPCRDSLGNPKGPT